MNNRRKEIGKGIALSIRIKIGNFIAPNFNPRMEAVKPQAVAAPWLAGASVSQSRSWSRPNGLNRLSTYDEGTIVSGLISSPTMKAD
jgi:hypothetical protein